jgi:hypothetical protein
MNKTIKIIALLASILASNNVLSDQCNNNDIYFKLLKSAASLDTQIKILRPVPITEKLQTDFQILSSALQAVEQQSHEYQIIIDGLFANDSSEISMIDLQNVVSQRELALQLVVNLLNSIHDADKDLIKNIGGCKDCDHQP